MDFLCWTASRNSVGMSAGFYESEKSRAEDSSHGLERKANVTGHTVCKRPVTEKQNGQTIRMHIHAAIRPGLFNVVLL